jgi:hypothetical protein
MATDIPMQWEIIRQDSPPMIRIKVSGSFDVAKCKGILDGIAEVKGSNPFFPILIDDREAELSGLDHNDLIEIGNLFMQNQSVLAFSRIALLMKPGPDFDTATKLQKLIDGNAIVTFDIFSNEKKALKWLG